MKKYSVLDLFCGCGGLSKGFEMAGYDIALGVDFNQPALDNYAFNHKGSKTLFGDLRDYAFLESGGWRVIVVWECELGKANFLDTVSEIQRQLDINRESWLEDMADRRKWREEWREVMKRRKEETTRIYTELKNRFIL